MGSGHLLQQSRLFRCLVHMHNLLLFRLYPSGRTVRKLPFLALTRGEERDMKSFLVSLGKQVEDQAKGVLDLTKSVNTS